MTVNEALLEVKGLVKSYDGNRVLNDISFTVAPGEFLTMLGPSGCGKTTTLRIIAGLTEPDGGDIRLNGQDISNLPPEKRDVNTVFQSYALFPHMNVEKNIAYGLKLKGLKKEVRQQKVREMLRLVRLEGYEKRMPSQLSGGQRQRIAIARAVVLEPKILLLDEPLGALDLKLRQQMQFELKEIQRNLGIAFVYITHDQEEALNMSDRIAVMNQGMIEQMGTPEEIYEHPQTRFAAEFIGQSVLLESNIAERNPDGSLILEYEGLRFPARKSDGELTGGRAALCLRTERLSVSQEKTCETSLPAKVLSRQYAGGVLRTVVRIASGREIPVIRPAGGTGANVGDDVYLEWNRDDQAVVPV